MKKGPLPESKKKICQTVYATPEQVRQLRLLSDRTHVPQAEYIRQGIDLMLDREEALQVSKP